MKYSLEMILSLTQLDKTKTADICDIQDFFGRQSAEAVKLMWKNMNPTERNRFLWVLTSTCGEGMFNVYSAAIQSEIREKAYEEVFAEVRKTLQADSDKLYEGLKNCRDLELALTRKIEYHEDAIQHLTEKERALKRRSDDLDAREIQIADTEKAQAKIADALELLRESFDLLHR